jgi:hypothetical protein
MIQLADMRQGIEERISIQKEAENVYINIRDAYESGMTHWKEALLVTFRQTLHPMVKEHVKFLIMQNAKNKNKPGK